MAELQIYDDQRIHKAHELIESIEQGLGQPETYDRQIQLQTLELMAGILEMVNVIEAYMRTDRAKGDDHRPGRFAGH